MNLVRILLMMNLVRILLMILTLFGFILLLSCTVGIAWGKERIQGKPDNATIYIGLWKYCQGPKCYTYDEESVDDWWYAIRVVMILSIFITVTAFILSIVMIANNNVKGFHLSLLLSLAVVLAIGGLSSWASKINPPSYVAYSFVLGWLGVATNLIALFGGIIEGRKV